MQTWIKHGPSRVSDRQEEGSEQHCHLFRSIEADVLNYSLQHCVQAPCPNVVNRGIHLQHHSTGWHLQQHYRVLWSLVAA